MKKYLLFFISILVFTIFGVVYFHDDGYDSIENKVKLVNQVFLKQVDSFSAMRNIQVNHSTKRKLDKEVSTYLDSILNTRMMIEFILSKPYVFDISRIKEDSYLVDSISNLNIQVKRLNTYLASFEKVLSKNNNHSIKKYNEIINQLNRKEIDRYIKKVSRLSNDMDLDIDTLEFLNQNKDYWYLEDETVIIKKRRVFNEFNDVKKSQLKDKISVQLINDSTGPKIDTKNVTIYVNQTISLENYVSCYDEVDDEVTCQIDGSYDSSMVGEYPISIKAVDQSDNSSEASFIVKVIKKVNQKPYSIDVIRNQNVVIVYGLDDEGEYTKIIKVFTCSTGSNNGTPTGNYATSKGAIWGALFGGVWGQYTTRIVGSILFHSVPYFTRDKGNLEWEEYNKLGTQASMGCVRLTVRDAKWIFYNIPVGTTVHIYDGGLPNGVSKPYIPKIDGSSPNRGWDPTDDDFSNPW